MLHRLWDWTSGGMTSWYEVKMFIEHASAVSSDALHVLAGIAVWLLAATVLRTSLAAWRPWLVVLALTLFNEAVDLWVERWPDLAIQYGESAKDILLTLAMPTLLTVLVRRRPRLFAGVRRSRR